MENLFEFESEHFEFEPEYDEELEDEARRRRKIPVRRAVTVRRPGSYKRPSRNKPRKYPRRSDGLRNLRSFGGSFSYNATPPDCTEYIKLVQGLLNKALGLNLLVDGIMSVETRSAIRSFQSQKDSSDEPAPTGIDAVSTEPSSQPPNGQEEYEAFEFNPFSEFEDEHEFESDYGEWESEVNRNSTDYIRWVQQSLNKIMGVKLAVDGSVGTQTRSAIRSFQQKQGLAVDGIVGAYTESAFIRAGASQPPQSSGTSSFSSFTIPTGTPDIVSVRGIKVARQIATQIEALLNAAQADGIKLGGGGYRSHEQQIKLRIAHCGGNTYENIYKKPSNQCTPPTATPGNSMHEKGLAIDFTYNGKTIKTRTNPGFVWLAKNAARFGLYNMPSEPWHWSVNGN